MVVLTISTTGFIWQSALVLYQEKKLDGNLFGSARNSTLGFAKMLYINLPTRFDRDDAIFMQSTVAGLTPDRAVAVDASTLDESGKGFPPSESNELPKPGIRACTRSHANLWKQMVKENWETLLVLEADAAWDSNIREINYRVAKGLYELRKNLNESTQLPSADDPFGVRDGDWDIISFGTCHDGRHNKDDFVMINDPDMPDNFNYYGRPLAGQRVVRKAGRMVCTTGYAISQKGAAKLLLRTALTLNIPIDLMLDGLIRDGDVKVYSTYPPTIAQWVYAEGIGAEGLGSSIENPEAKKNENAKEIWKKVKSERNIWTLKKSFRGTIKNMALAAYNKLAYD